MGMGTCSYIRPLVLFLFLITYWIFESIVLAIAMAKHIIPTVCLLIMIMDIVAGVLGIEAEISQNKVKNLRVWVLECRDPSNQAFKLGLGAVVLLSLAHTIATLLGGCICVWSKDDLDKSSANKKLAVASLVLSWITLVVGFSMLIIGTMDNSKSRKSCGISHQRVLSIGGILCFFHGLFAVSSYVSGVAVMREQEKLNQPGKVEPA